jgi:hypothetical protein
MGLSQYRLAKEIEVRAQAAYDTKVAERNIGPSLKNIKPWSEHAARQG